MGVSSQQPGLVTLAVYGRDRSDRHHEYLVQLGELELINREKVGLAGAPVNHSTEISLQEETWRYGAIAYRLLDADLDSIRPLNGLLAGASAETCGTVIRNLFSETLSPWYQNRSQAHRVPLTETRWTSGTLQNAIVALCQQVQKFGVHSITFTENGLEFGQNWLAWQSLHQFIETLPRFAQQPIFESDIHGCLVGGNILTSGSLKTWLIGFGFVSKGTPLHDCVTLEADLLLNGFHHLSVADRLSLVPFLVDDDVQAETWRDQVAVRDERFTRLATVYLIRKFARELGGCSAETYTTALLWHYLDYILNFTVTETGIRRDLFSYLYALYFVLTYCSNHIQQPVSPIELDESSRKIRFHGGDWIKLAPTEFSLINYFVENANQLCMREDLLKHLFDTDIDDLNMVSSDRKRLRVSIGRLRAKIEDSGNTRIETEHGKGYLLRL